LEKAGAVQGQGEYLNFGVAIDIDVPRQGIFIGEETIKLKDVKKK
jgi:hypothetical protein